MKKIYLLPNMITAFGLTCGLFVIFKMNMIMVGDVTQNVLLATAGILILAALADLLDGAIARAMKAESAFGTLFDSLADAISFGVAPAVVVLKTLSIEPGTEASFFMTAAAMIYTVCGVLRLIRYNVTAAESDKDLNLLANKNFIGLPIPAACGAVISLNLFLNNCTILSICSADVTTKGVILFFGLILIGYLMISRWRFPSFKTLSIRVSSFKMVLFTVIAAVLIFYGILHHFTLIFFMMTWLYVIISLILSIIRITTGRKSKTLEDFEPKDDDQLD